MVEYLFRGSLGMSQWRSAKARRVLTALLRIGWNIKRQTGSHKILSRPGWQDIVFAFHDNEELGPRMREIRCHISGNSDFEERKVEYIYRRNGNYLVVRDIPCEVCLHCGERYYAGTSLLEIEQRFKAIYEQHAKPQSEIQVPVEVFAYSNAKMVNQSRSETADTASAVLFFSSPVLYSARCKSESSDSPTAARPLSSTR